MKFFLSGLLLSTNVLFTLSQTEDTIRLEDVYIYSSLTEVRQKQNLRSLTIISQDQLNQRNASTIEDVIRYLPGLETQSRNLFGVQTDYSIRGSTFNQVLVLLDGVRLNDPLTGHFSSYIPVPLSEISRIELIRGPGAIMYGPDAVGGIINIISNNISTRADSMFIVNFRSGAGEYELLSTDAGFLKSSGKLNYSGGIKHISSGGYPDIEGFRDDFRLRSATFSIAFPVGDKLRMTLRTAVDGREFSARRFYTISLADTARENVKTWWNHLNATIQGAASASTIDFTFKTTSDEYIFNAYTPSNDHVTNQIITQFRNHREVTKNIMLTSGIQTYYQSIESNDRGNHDMFSGGVYAVSNFTPVRFLTFSGGLRLEYIHNTGIDFLPQINLSYNTGILTLRGLAGKTIRTPDFTERYISTNLSSLTPGRNLGNPDLLPEKSWSFEAGAGIAPGKGILFDITAFRRYGSDLIDYVLTSAAFININQPLLTDGQYLYAKNIAHLTTNGLEFILTGDFANVMNGVINGTLGYTIQRSGSSEREVSKYISNQCRQLITADLRYCRRRLGASMNSIYKQRDPQFAQAINSSIENSYWLINTQVDYEMIAHKLSLKIRADNIFNTSYSDILGAVLPGRWISAGVHFRIR